MVAVKEFSWEEISGPDFGNPARQAWREAVTQVEEQLCAKLRVEVLPERMRKALDLVRADAVTLHTDGSASVQSGKQTYTLAPDCPCADAKHRAELCKHALAVELHRRALALVEGTAPAPASSATPAAPSTSPPAAAAAPPPAALPSAPASAAWDVHEAPVSSCFKIRVGALEWTHTMRGTDDAELQPRLQTFLPTFRDIAAALEAMHAEREAAKAAPAAPRPPAPQPASAPADLQALIQQAVQQALAAANGQAPGTPPPAPPHHGAAPSAPEPDDQQTGFCSIHQVQMEQKSNERGTWYSHWLRGEQQHCKGRRNGRR
jgi:hypothetical protein